MTENLNWHAGKVYLGLSMSYYFSFKKIDFFALQSKQGVAILYLV